EKGRGQGAAETQDRCAQRGPAARARSEAAAPGADRGPYGGRDRARAAPDGGVQAARRSGIRHRGRGGRGRRRQGERPGGGWARAVVGRVFRPGAYSVDYLTHPPPTAFALVAAGVPTAIGSFGDERAGQWGPGASRFLADSAALAASRGLSRDQGLAAITIEA